MSRTLFGYIFWDLVKIFALTSGVLSAIMNFGGMLRPLYEHGLAIAQVGEILTYAGPAMTAYSLPIAALFATTIVYGRFGADNEVTACRAAGISYLSIAMPAIVLGLLTATISLVLLCFVVPVSMLRVEKIIYSNLAMLASNEIERTHQIRFSQADRPGITVFAQSAKALDPDPAYPDEQVVEFVGPLIVQYEKPAKNDKSKIQTPETFYMAQRAIAYLRPKANEDGLTLTVQLEKGASFPRGLAENPEQGMHMAIEETSFGPMDLPSPVPENEKFMDIFKLREMLKAPEKSERIQTLLRNFDRRDQQEAYLQQVLKQVNSEAGFVDLAGKNESYRLTRSQKPAEIVGERLVVSSTPDRPVQFRQMLGSSFARQADEVRVRIVNIDLKNQLLQLRVEMLDAVEISNDADRAAPRSSLSRDVFVPMPQEIEALNTRPAAEYLNARLSNEDKQTLNRNLFRLNNKVISELHARMSFAVSCFILVLIGCALGLMFRSGNFLSAFAVSVVPALISIALIVTGQHTCENVPSPLPLNWNNAQQLAMGVGLIWSGNTAVLAIATTLLAKLQRQ